MRKPRIGSEYDCYHVTSHGVGDEYIFPDDVYKEYYLDCIAKRRAKYKIKVIAYCIMGNHVHILLKALSLDDLTKYMHIVNTDYALFYNKEKKRKGCVFRERFKSTEPEYGRGVFFCACYIHDNPVQAGVVKKPGDYRFSSYNAYITRNGIIDFNEASKLFDLSKERMFSYIADSEKCDYHSYYDKKYDNENELIENHLKRYMLSDAEQLKKHPDIVKIIVRDLQKHCGTSLREIEKLLKIPKSTLSRILNEPLEP
jgi:REP element-mobilizing transposase RayT